jgi:hypothetical protein
MSLNTLRLITIRQAEDISLFIAAQRIGCGKAVDNWAAGGILVAVDTASGCLRGPGFFKPGSGTTVISHPLTGEKLDGYRIPFFREAVEAVARFHLDLPSRFSVGWDVAISRNGPVIVEGNDGWGAGVAALDHDFKARFLAAFGT